MSGDQDIHGGSVRASETWVVRDPLVLGEVIRAARDASGVTQAELAEAAGLHRSYLSNLERGVATDQTERLFRVLRRLGLEIRIDVPSQSPDADADADADANADADGAG